MKKRAKPAPNPPQKGLWGWGLPRLMLFLFLLAAAPKGFAGGWEGSGGGGGRAGTPARDAAGRTTALGDTHSNQPWRFGYAAASRLTGAARADYAASYTYDKNGNRAGRVRPGHPLRLRRRQQPAGLYQASVAESGFFRRCLMVAERAKAHAAGRNGR